MKRWIWIATALLALLGAGTAYVVIPVARHLSAAQDVIAAGDDELSRRALQRANADLIAARDRLDALPAKVVGTIPVVGSNLRSIRSVTAALLPVVDAATDLARRSRDFRKVGFITDGRIRVAALSDLHDPLSREVRALRRLEEVTDEAMGATTFPPLWDRLMKLQARASELRADLDHARTLSRVTPHLLGATAPRRYLVMLMNNAELRGAGGILAAVGSLTFEDGKLRLEDLTSVHDLDVTPRLRVPAPPTYQRRYGRYDANTTLWLNATFSPDVPDVAKVAARLYKRVTGKTTRGAVLLDPRGLAALLGDAELDLPRLGTIKGDEIPKAVYSDAYEAFSDQDERRDAILQLGESAFRRLIAEGLPDDGIDAIGEAVSGGHLSFVSFVPEEQRALDGVGAAHDIPKVGDDLLMVRLQNFGGGGGEGSKLDYWTKRTAEHACDIDVDGGTCATTVRLGNRVPKGLTRYVVGRPYGLLRSYVEIFVPRDAHLEEVRVDGRAAEFRPEPHDDMLSVGVYVEVPPKKAREITVVYRLDAIGSSYDFVALPQPLARDGRVSIAIGLPDGWTDADGRRNVRISETFDSAIGITARPDSRRGLSALWERVKRFWNEPVF